MGVEGCHMNCTLHSLRPAGGSSGSGGLPLAVQPPPPGSWRSPSLSVFSSSLWSAPPPLPLEASLERGCSLDTGKF